MRTCAGGLGWNMWSGRRGCQSRSRATGGSAGFWSKQGELRNRGSRGMSGSVSCGAGDRRAAEKLVFLQSLVSVRRGITSGFAKRRTESDIRERNSKFCAEFFRSFRGVCSYAVQIPSKLFSPKPHTQPAARYSLRTRSPATDRYARGSCNEIHTICIAISPSGASHMIDRRRATMGSERR